MVPGRSAGGDVGAGVALLLGVLCCAGGPQVTVARESLRYNHSITIMML